MWLCENKLVISDEYMEIDAGEEEMSEEEDDSCLETPRIEMQKKK